MLETVPRPPRVTRTQMYQINTVRTPVVRKTQCSQRARTDKGPTKSTSWDRHGSIHHSYPILYILPASPHHVPTSSTMHVPHGDHCGHQQAMDREGDHHSLSRPRGHGSSLWYAKGAKSGNKSGWNTANITYTTTHNLPRQA